MLFLLNVIYCKQDVFRREVSYVRLYWKLCEADKQSCSTTYLFHIYSPPSKDLSRIGRNYIEVGRYLRDFFPTYHIHFISVEDNIDSIRLDRFERTIALMKSIFSEQYSRDVSLKTHSVLDVKRRKGEYVGAIPIYGYQKSSETKNKLVPDLNTLAVVQFIFEMKLQGMSAAGIAATLNDSGELSPLAYKQKHSFPHPTGGFADDHHSKWSVATIIRILQDETYTGTLVQGKQSRLNYKSRTILHLDEGEWIKVKNTHLSIMAKLDYNAVQRILAKDTRAAPLQSLVYIFSGLLICGHCGCNLVRKTSRNTPATIVQQAKGTAARPRSGFVRRICWIGQPVR